MGLTLPIVRLSSSRTLVILSDIHIGADEHAETRFDQALDWCREADATIVLNGDIVENAIIEGKSPGEKLLAQGMMPTAQLKLAIDKFRPFAKRGKIAGITRGNHDARTRRSALLDICDILSHALSVPYWGVGGMIRFITGKQVYQGAIHHGRGGGKNIWLELDRLLGLYNDADFAALGHNHSLAAREVYHLKADQEGAESVGKRHQVRTGSYLYYPDYVREMAAPPNPVGSPILRFAPKDHSIEVDTHTLRWFD